MRGRRATVGEFAKLLGIGSGHENCGQHNQQENRAQNDSRKLLQGTHWLFHTNARPAISASELAASITRQTNRVTLTMSGKSRLRAACQASCPTPGESHRA